MRLYLSSFRLGTEPEHLVRLAGRGARMAVVANAVDEDPADVRREKVDAEIRALSALDLDATELDLRDHSGSTHPASIVLDQLAERYEREGVPHLRLRDGEALVVDGDDTSVVGRPATVDELIAAYPR